MSLPPDKTNLYRDMWTAKQDVCPDCDGLRSFPRSRDPEAPEDPCPTCNGSGEPPSPDYGSILDDTTRAVMGDWWNL